MKVIGLVKDGYLIECSRQEMANLYGHSEPRHMYDLKIGDAVNVSPMFTKLYQQAQNRSAMGELATKLEAIAALLREEDPIMEAVAEGKDIEKVKSET